MSGTFTIDVTRRAFLGGAGALVVSFSLLSRGRAQEAPPAEPETPELPGSLDDEPFLDSWIRIDAEGHVTVFTGKAELGQALAADDLELVHA